jgi:molybdenum cofactor synthesis domain-containing protein
VSDPAFSAVIITVSTSRANGEAEDTGGPALAAYAEGLGARIEASEVLPDDREAIAGRLAYWADSGACDLILTTGGTGFSPDDVTPEATRDVIDREAPGIPEAMRAASREHTAMWMTSRGVCGTRGGALIINFPGNPPAIEQAGAAIAKAIPHAVSLLSGRRDGHPQR